MIHFPQQTHKDWRQTIAETHGKEIPGQIDHEYFIDYASALMGEDISGIRKTADERVRGTLKAPYNMRPLDQYKAESAYTAKHEAINLNPLTAGKDDRQMWERTVGMAQRKTAWLDRHNSGLMKGIDGNGDNYNRKIDNITMSEVRANPTLARILAGFALQDGEAVPFTMAKDVQIKPRSETPLYPPVNSPWSKTAAMKDISNASAGVGFWGKIKSGLKKLKFW